MSKDCPRVCDSARDTSSDDDVVVVFVRHHTHTTVDVEKAKRECSILILSSSGKEKLYLISVTHRQSKRKRMKELFFET